MIKVVNLRNYVKEPDWEFVRVDRASVLGNPFVMANESMRTEVCDKYALYFEDAVKNNMPFRAEVIRIYRMAKEGKNIALACWCFPKKCHAMYIKEFIEKYL